MKRRMMNVVTGAVVEMDIPAAEIEASRQLEAKVAVAEEKALDERDRLLVAVLQDVEDRLRKLENAPPLGKGEYRAKVAAMRRRLQ